MSALASVTTSRELGALAMRYGVGTLVGAFLVYKVTGSFDQRLVATELAVRELSVQLEKHQASMDRAEAERRASDQVTRMMLRGICLGTSGDLPQARALCEIGGGR